MQGARVGTNDSGLIQELTCISDTAAKALRCEILSSTALSLMLKQLEGKRCFLPVLG